MKVYAVVSRYEHEGSVEDVTLFPRAFKSVEEARHAVDEDAVEQWSLAVGSDPADDQLKFPGLDALLGGDLWLEFAEDAGVRYQINELEVE